MLMKFLLAREKEDSKELQEAFKKMQEQVKAVGGRFTFILRIDDEGWVARCKEFDGIVTGGANKNPSEEEVICSIIDAVKTAFHIPIGKLEIKRKQRLELPPIKTTIIRERELQFV